MRKTDLYFIRPILFFLFFLPSVLLMVSCNSSGGKLQNGATDSGSSQKYSAKYYVDNNSYLDDYGIYISYDMGINICTVFGCLRMFICSSLFLVLHDSCGM